MSNITFLLKNAYEINIIKQLFPNVTHKID